MSCSSKTIAISLDFVIAITVISLFLFVESGYVTPMKTIGFYCNDPKLLYKLNGECVTSMTVLLTTFAFPIFVFSFVELFTCKGIKNRTSWFKRSCLRYADFLHGSIFTLVVTEICKILFGEPRPHFFDSCKPLEAVNCTTGEYIADYTCTNDKYHLNISDTYKSFPSGHASLACFTSLYFALYFNEKIRTMARTFLSILYIVCFIWALFCSVTRIIDRRHHWWDVLMGATLGLSAAWYYYDRKFYYARLEKVDVAEKPVIKRLISPNA